jgi:hypothetical protein
MGLRVIEYTIVLANTIEIFTTPMNEETLESVMLMLTETLIEPNVARGQIGIMEGGATLAHRIAVLADDYLDTLSCPAWTGSLHLNKHSYLYAAVISDTTRRFRLNAIIHDFIPPALREKPSG